MRVRSIARLTAAIIPLGLLMAACLETEQYGLPQSVYFGEEGGTQIYHSDRLPSSLTISIEDGKKYAEINPHYPAAESTQDDEASVSLDWLTVTYRYADNEIELTAQPMTEGKHRKFKVEYFYGYGSAETKVNQTR